LQTGIERAELRRVRVGPPKLERAEVGVRALDEAENRVRVLEENVARVGELDRAPPLRPFDQAMSDPSLEDGDLLADRRLSEAEARRGAAEGALEGDRPQRREVAQLDPGPGTEGAEGSGAAFVAAGGQPPFCFPPAWVCAMSKEPAITRG
jgi:hypothetical protein